LLTGYDSRESHEVLLQSLDLVDIFGPLLRDEAEPFWAMGQVATKYQCQLTSTLRERERERERETLTTARQTA
jgi:hypothetical protein